MPQYQQKLALEIDCKSIGAREASVDNGAFMTVVENEIRPVQHGEVLNQSQYVVDEVVVVGDEELVGTNSDNVVERVELWIAMRFDMRQYLRLSVPCKRLDCVVRLLMVDDIDESAA